MLRENRFFCVLLKGFRHVVRNPPSPCCGGYFRDGCLLFRCEHVDPKYSSPECPSSSHSSRLVAIPVNIIIAWPYGLYRDAVMRFARRVSPAGWVKNLADVLAYVTFQSPVYVAILLTVGADWHQIAAAVSSNIVISMLMGAVYGLFPRLLSPPV